MCCNPSLPHLILMGRGSERRRDTQERSFSSHCFFMSDACSRAVIVGEVLLVLIAKALRDGGVGFEVRTPKSEWHLTLGCMLYPSVHRGKCERVTSGPWSKKKKKKIPCGNIVKILSTSGNYMLTWIVWTPNQSNANLDLVMMDKEELIKAEFSLEGGRWQ